MVVTPAYRFGTEGQSGGCNAHLWQNRASPEWAKEPTFCHIRRLCATDRSRFRRFAAQTRATPQMDCYHNEELHPKRSGQNKRIAS